MKMNKLFYFLHGPKEWDVNLKVYAPDNTSIECIYKDGKVIKMSTLPHKTKTVIQLEK
jgi:hypothetical protein